MSRAGRLALLLALLPAAASTAGEVASKRALAHAELWPRLEHEALLDAGGEAFVSRLMSRMSLREKVGQLIQADIDHIAPSDLRRYPLGAVLAGGDAVPIGGDVRAAPALWLATTRAFDAIARQPRPGHAPIPLLFGIDAVHGNAHVRGATVFPHHIGLGATHDAALIRRIDEVTARETLALGINWIFAPTVAVPQDLRWGRSYEGYSQDPAQVREYAAASVRGLQASGRLAATAKHFIGDGGTTGGIDEGDTDLTEEQLIATHAPGFLGAIDAGVLSVMASYSSWQGQKMHGNRSLLSEVLKHRLGFDGLVVGDWNGHGQLPGCSNGSCPDAINAGIDMLMAPEAWRELFDATLEQVRAGTIAPARLEDAVRRILRVKVRIGLFEPAPREQGALELVGASGHRTLAREAVRRSLVLLKNNGGVLPIAPSAQVLVAGAAADDIGQQCGGWTLTWQGSVQHNADFPNGQSIYAGIAAAIERGGGSVEFSPDGRYEHRPDVAVVVYGEPPYAERRGDRPDLAFEDQGSATLALLQRLHEAHVPVVSVFLSGRPLWVNRELNASDAFVAAWLPGSQGQGVADVLFAEAGGSPRYDFSGALPFAWPSASIGGAALFPLGYGLHYGDATVVPELPVLAQ